MGDRRYLPQPWIHEASCQDVPRGLPTIKVRDLPTAHPYGRPHHCVDKDTVTFNRDCVAEVVDYVPHPYRYSTIWPPDATGPLCSTCRGSHPESAAEAGRRQRVALAHPLTPTFPVCPRDRVRNAAAQKYKMSGGEGAVR